MLTRQDQVLATPELVELILVQLPIKDLLSASLVSKAWHATTLTPALQRALFFLPDPASAEPIQNPLLAALFPPFFDASKCRQTWTIMAMPWAKAPDAFKRAQASWRRMLLTQSPARTMAITHTFGRSVQRAMLGSDVDPEALRMGLLYDVTLQLVDGKGSTFEVHWPHGCASCKGDLTLAIRNPCRIRIGPPRKVGEEFHSDAEQEVEVGFGEWEGRDA